MNITVTVPIRLQLLGLQQTVTIIKIKLSLKRKNVISSFTLHKHQQTLKKSYCRHEYTCVHIDT